jgi:cytidylate kinase
MAIITISRGTFSGGQSLAESVARKLGYRCLSREVLVTTAKQYGISEEKLSAAISEAPGVLERLHSERKRYLACLRSALIKEVKDDNVVYHGHAGHLLLEGVPQVLRVRIVANMEFRIRTLIEHRNLSRGEAIQFIKTVDEKRVRWTQFLYHVDWRDPSLYDLVINIDQVSLEGACEIVCNTANLEQYKTTPESKKRRNNLILSSNLEALIANTRSISGGKGVKIEADEGVVTIEGTVGSLVDADRVRMLVLKTPGVMEINSRMRVILCGVTTGNINGIG